MVHSDRLKHAYLKPAIRRGLMGVYSSWAFIATLILVTSTLYSSKTNVVLTCLIFLMCRLSWFSGSTVCYGFQGTQSSRDRYCKSTGHDTCWIRLETGVVCDTFVCCVCGKVCCVCVCVCVCVRVCMCLYEYQV